MERQISKLVDGTVFSVEGFRSCEKTERQSTLPSSASCTNLGSEVLSDKDENVVGGLRIHRALHHKKPESTSLFERSAGRSKTERISLDALPTPSRVNGCIGSPRSCRAAASRTRRSTSVCAERRGRSLFRDGYATASRRRRHALSPKKDVSLWTKSTRVASPSPDTSSYRKYLRNKK